MYFTTPPPLRLKIPANQGGFVKGVLKIGRACGANLASCGGSTPAAGGFFFWRFGTLFYTENTSQNAL